MTEEEFEWAMENFAPNLWASLKAEQTDEDEGSNDG